MTSTIKHHPVSSFLLGIGLSAIMAGSLCRAEDLPPPAAASKDVVLVLDNSGSMKSRDRQFWVRQVAEEFITHGDPLTKIAIVLFDEDGRIELPLSATSAATDPSIQAALEKINYKGLWTNISAALRRALEALGTDSAAHAAKTIVLLTDGRLETGDRRRDTAENSFLREKFLNEAGKQDIRVYTVGLGSTADTDLLQQIARETHGDYYWAPDGEGLKSVFEHIRQALAQDVRALPVAQADPETSPAPTPAAATQAPVPTVAQLPTSAAAVPTTAPAAEPVAPTAVAAKSEAKPKPTQKPVRQKKPVRPQNAEPADADGSDWWDFLPVALVGLAGLIGGYLLRERKHLIGTSTDEARTSLSTNSARACLYDLSGVTGRERHELNSSITLIGRVPPAPGERFGHITINSPTIGRRHAVIEYKHYGFWLLDQNSKNGSFVNDVRALKEVCLSHGDRIRFHEYEFEFSLLGMGLADETTGTGELILERRSGKST